MTYIKNSRFAVAEYLTNETLINAYLDKILVEGAFSDFTQHPNNVARSLTLWIYKLHLFLKAQYDL